MSDSKFSSKDFLKRRRPERYSDSVIIERSSLDRPVLEHHLATLNKRSQELAFENFVKLLCEKTICPNLLEQTGPVAGGDGKTDTQTFPVSEQNRNLWYEGINESSHKERWAFAVSTEEGWKNKCRKDVRKIKETNRGYEKAFFVTNQYAKADQRSDVEDELTAETSIDVRILDISWLLDQTFKADFIDIAIETLSIRSVNANIISKGPNDYRREKELEEIHARIKKEVSPSEILVTQVDWFIEVAILSKECEKDIIETQGLFDRAIRIANQFGTTQQKFDAHYQYAWASHWWFEDFKLFEMHLAHAYDYVKDSLNSTRWQDFVTLLSVYFGYTKLNKVESSIDIETIYSSTIDVLRDIAVDDARPSNSLQARTSRALLKLVKIASIDDSRPIFTDLLEIVKESTCLVGYPFESFFEMVSELEFVFGEIKEYEALLDFLTDHSSVRHGDVQVSMKDLRRGAKKLEDGKPYQAIKLIGKSLAGLYKNESQRDIYAALNIISQAYFDIGLYWASRGSLLLAASLITNDFWKHEELSPAQVKSYLRLTWAELKLGRISHALSWLKLALFVDANLEKSIIKESEFMNMDGFLSHIILNAGRKDYLLFEKLPDVLDEVGFLNSRGMALYCLGYEKQVGQEYEIDINQEFIDYLILVRDYDFEMATPFINLFSGKWGEISSTVLGCLITISFPKKTPFVEMAESMLSAIEGFCSTGLVNKAVSTESNLIIDIVADDDDGIKILHEIDVSGNQLEVTVSCSSFSENMLNVSGQQIIQEWMHGFILEIYRHIVAPIDINDSIQSLLMDERALERSVSFTSSFTMQHNILGNNAIDDIASLFDNKKYNRYKVERKNDWDSQLPSKILKQKKLSDISPGEGEPPDDMFNMEALSHSNVKTHGLIKPRLWDKALWMGVGFIEYQDRVPIMALLFEHENTGKAVFMSLLSAIGSNDSDNRLRVSIIQNISLEEPFSYKVMLSENPKMDEDSEVKMFNIISRIQTMKPDSNENLVRFLQGYKNKKTFGLTYGIVKSSNPTFPVDFKSNLILKKELIIVDANKIGPNEIEIVALKNE